MLQGVRMTDEEQKQIETMAIVMCENFELRMRNQTCTKCRTYNKNCYTIHKAELLHSAGYRNADEVRKETAEKILRDLYSEATSNVSETVELTTFQIEQLAKQFGVEIKE